MSTRPRPVGINHVALAVGDLEEALAFYGEIFAIELRGRVPRMAFIDLGDQFLALAEGGRSGIDEERHFGLVVDDREAARVAAVAAGADVLPGRGLRIRDPWGNTVEIVDYRDVQFTKAPAVLGGMDLTGLDKRPEALEELRRKGLA